MNFYSVKPPKLRAYMFPWHSLAYPTVVDKVSKGAEPEFRALVHKDPKGPKYLPGLYLPI